MSWVKKRGQNSATIPPNVQMYNPDQPPAQEWQQVQRQANYWQQPYQQQQFQQYGQQYCPQNNLNSYQQPQQQQQPPQQQQRQPAFGNLQYSQQYNMQNNTFEPQQVQQGQETDGWGSNWGWGDEDNSNLNSNSNVQVATNVITESFANDETWNWSIEDANSKEKLSGTPLELKNNPPTEQCIGKRGKLDTPQWSVESQLSQESSDDILQTSESDKSRMLSRSSTISHSPISGQDQGVSLQEEAKQELNVFENKEILVTKLTCPPVLKSQNTEDLKSNPYKRNTITPKYAMPVNLETLPDNSEHPDQLQLNQSSQLHNFPENIEMPINDRNQYLETGQLLDVDLNNCSQEDTLPPPGLSRMVLGQMKQEESLPSFSTRIIPGQTESNTDGGINLSSEPPEGLHRMIPGESSSPESILRQQERRDDSESEMNEINNHTPQTRSATIGADTPPGTGGGSRSNVLGADISLDPNIGLESNRGKGDNRRAGALSKTGKKQTNRRDSVEGQPQDIDVSGIVNSVRNMNVGDHQSDDNQLDSHERRHSRQETSSDSERERRAISPRERRYREKGDMYDRDRTRNKYSPDDYRDRKYDGRRRYRERRYEEDTDYLSDKERRHKEERDREYERKYNSLKKDKEKDRKKRDDRRDYGRDSRKSDYYYGRYEEDYEHESRSRASSRSDSIHDSYKDRGHDRDRRDRRHHREKERHRRHKDPYNPYSQGFGYDMYSQYYQQYHYYENLRKTNPQAYAQLYRKYYQEAGSTPSYVNEDRASVHSGRSSTNDDLNKDRYTRQSYYSQTSLPHLGGCYRGSQAHSVSGQYGLDDFSFTRTFDQTDNSLNYEDPNMTTQRLTPAKFATAHVKASISSGRVVKILPHYPLDGQAPTVELCNLDSLLSNYEEYQELKKFPGPLVKGVTHKKTIIEFCESKIKAASNNLEINDPDSYILMWELLILLIRQNGMVVGTDIAELLLKNRDQEQPQRSASVISSVGSNINETSESNNPLTSDYIPTESLKEEEVTKTFREYLLYGSCKEALEWAMKHGLWGHALFLASKLDKRTYANVLMRFANGLTMNDPLQTLYQLLSGKTPAAVTCIADEKWGDWRPHLAMILSNSTQRPELNCKAITILGDTLFNRGSLYAAQFCYLMAEVGFSTYGSTDAKLVLLGSDHNKSFLNFAVNEAIQMTEIYEYACSLNDNNFSLINFQRYKYLLATRLADVGLLERALSYLEKIANFIVQNPNALEVDLVNQVATLADRLKFNDLVTDDVEDDEYATDLDTSRPDNSWLKELKKIQNDYHSGVISQNTFASDNIYQQCQVYGQVQEVNQQAQYKSEQITEDAPIEFQQESDVQHGNYISVPYNQEQQQQQPYWETQQQWADQSTTYHQDSTEVPNYDSLAHSENIPQPQISLPNQHDVKKSTIDGDKPKESSKNPGRSIVTQQDNKQVGDGWFSGIFKKLSLKPKNPMNLPDDKNPSIVWDHDKKRWVNTHEDNADGVSEFKPPPKMSEIAPKMNDVTSQMQHNFNRMQQPITQQPIQFANNNSNTTDSVNDNMKNSLPNMYKLQKKRNLKKSYVDVFNPNGNMGGGSQAAVGSLPSTGAVPQAPMNFFIPQPINDPNAPTDFLTPGGVPVIQNDDNSQKQDE